MSSQPRPRIGHIGLNIRDAEKMKDFYTRVMGFTVTDQGPHPVNACPMMFLSTNPEEHHEIVLIGGRPDDADYSAAQQLSFLLEDLDELRQMRDSLVANGTEVDRYACHGNAWSIYFHDPEGNYLELYAHTPWYIPQPYGLPFDLDQTNEEIMRSTEQLCRENPGFMMETERKAKARQTMLD